MSLLGYSIRSFLCLLGAVVIVACGGGSGSEVTELIDTTERSFTPSNYSGPKAKTDDTQRFKLNLWDNLVADSRCGACHRDGGQTPTFVRTDDINLAYTQANSIVNLSMPAESVLVTKVAGGHNCWLSDDGACEDLLIRWITAWASDSVVTSSSEVALSAPIIKTPGQSKNFPNDSSGFAGTGSIHELLIQYCSECHSEDADIPQSPYFASLDIDIAYEAVSTKIDLDEPGLSRLVIRLRDEFHNCWGSCDSNAAEILSRITAYAQIIPLTEVNDAWLTSKALQLTDGIVASQGGRFEPNMIAFYEFKTGSGTTAFDTSGVSPALDLTLSGQYEWVGSWGIKIIDGKAQGTTAASKKLHDLIKATNEYSVEAWIVPGNVTQEDAVIVGYSGGPDTRNFGLQQTLYNYDFRHRSNTTGANGDPALSTSDADEVLQASLQHVVITYDSVNGRQIYVDTERIDIQDAQEAGSLAAWDDTFALVLGNEVSSTGLWQGTIRQLAIHNRALTSEQIFQNYEVGVGQKFYLLFQVTDFVDIPQAYIVFEVSQFDNYSYLFNAPFFVSLQANVMIDTTVIKGLHIGMNGQEVEVGQAFSTLDTTINAADYVEGRQTLSTLGTIVALEKGPDQDEFFLTFDQLGAETFVRTDNSSLTLASDANLDPISDIGLRHFAEIQATFSALTGVSTQQGKGQASGVYPTYQLIQQQLPPQENIEGFLAAQQMAITQLAISYCDALISDINLRSGFFIQFDSSRFVQSPSVALDSVGRSLLVQDLLDQLVGSGLNTQPADSTISNELDDLIRQLTNSCSLCNTADRTQTIAKASCAAVLGSAITVLQ